MPSPRVLVAWMVPLLASRMPRTMERPRPVPRTSVFGREKRLEDLGHVAFGDAAAGAVIFARTPRNLGAYGCGPLA
jgi:hypothetical protein